MFTRAINIYKKNAHAPCQAKMDPAVLRCWSLIAENPCINERCIMGIPN